jgi:YegS/Rv2252/BmrU family lipid kinase
MPFEASVAAALQPPSASSPRRLCVIYNPTAGGANGRRLRRTIDALRATGCVLELCETTQRGDAERFAAACDRLNTDAVVVAGGDGTVNEALNGLMRRPPEERLPLGVIPLGTANVLALDMGQALKPAAIAATLAVGQPRAVYMASIDSLAVAASVDQRRRYFLLMGGAGFDAHVVDSVRLGLKRHTGKFAYVLETLLQAVRYRFPAVEGSIDGSAFSTATAVICNGPLYGGPFVAAPKASLHDSPLYVLLLHRKGLWHVLRYAVALAMGRLTGLKDVEVRAFEQLELLQPASAPFQADGDVVAHLPIRVVQGKETVQLLWPTPTSQ